MFRLWFTALLLVTPIACSAVQAADVPKGCFQKDYAKSYLKKVENQFITSIQVEVAKGILPSSKPTLAGTIRGKFRDDKNIWWSGQFECVDGGASWSCIMACDGGTFIMSRVKSGLQVVNQSFLRFSKQNCDAEPRDLRADKEHTVFTLQHLSSTKCKN